MPSEVIEQLLLQLTPASMGTMRERAAEFSSPMEMKLTAIALSPVYRAAAETALDRFWSDPSRNQRLPFSVNSRREVIIGSGYHAAVYATTRARLGYPKPIVLERSRRVGGTFAMTESPTFYLNSRNRPGKGGLAGDRRASLNYLPGAPIQAANISMLEYQTNADMAFAIRIALAEHADVMTGVTVDSLYGSDLAVTTEDESYTLVPGRIIDARGLGDPTATSDPASRIFNFPDFMKHMSGTWPLRGVRQVAVVGGGDSAKCAVEAIIGIGPQSSLTVPVLDNVERIDWYAENLPSNCNTWRRDVRGRYQAIGPSLRADRFGERRINVYNESAPEPIALPSGDALIGGRSYDMIVMATGGGEQLLPGLNRRDTEDYYVGGRVVARRGYNINENLFRVGPHARLPFDEQEKDSGVADIPANAVSMFRTGTKTAALAADLPNL